MKKLDRPMEILTSVFKWLYIIHIMFAGNNVIYDTPIEKTTSLLVLGLGSIVVLWRFINVKDYINYPFIKLYALFAVSFVVSLLANWQFGWFANFKILIWMTLQFVALYTFDLRRSKEKVTKEFHISLILIMTFMTIVNFIGIIMLFTNYLHFRILDESKAFLIGVAYWGRLYGLHVDPNYGAVLSVMATMSALYFFITVEKKWLKVLLGLPIFIQLMSMAFLASRTGMVTICVCVAVFFFVYAMTQRKKIVKSAIISLAAIAFVLCANKGITVTYNSYTQMIHQRNEIKKESVKEEVELEKELVKIGRETELSNDVSNRRFDLWKNAMQIFVKNPIIGIGYGNYVSYAQAELPDCYLLTNGFAIFDAFHNMFMDLLASQGILGAIIFATIIILSLIYMLKNYKKIPEEDWTKCTLLFSCCIGFVVAGLFVTHILYVNNQTTVVFWVMWGFLMYYVTKAAKTEDR